MIVVSMILEVAPEDRDALVAAMLRMAFASQAEPGCIVYRYTGDLEHPNRLHLTELWEDEDAVASHLTTAHTAEFVPILRRLARITFVRGFNGAMEKYRIPVPPAHS